MNKPRLIDANELIKGFYEHTNGGKQRYLIPEEIWEMVELAPTAYDIDKIVEQLEKEERRAVVNFHNSRGFKVPESYGQKIAFEKAIEIVKGNCCKNGNCSDQFTDADKMEGGAE